jgi:hypothetical protein
MGRAIDMEKDIDALKTRLDLAEKALSKVIDVVGSMEEKGQRTTHVDLVEDVPSEVEEKPKSKKSSEKAKRTKKD